MVWFFFCLAAQGLTLKSGQLLVCDAYLVKAGILVLTRDGVQYTLRETYIDWAIPIKTMYPTEQSDDPGSFIAQPPRQNHDMGIDLPEFLIEKIEVKQASLIDVLRLIADQVGFNLIIDSSVPDPPVTFSFKKIRWQDAMTVLLGTQNLSFEYFNRHVFVRPIALGIKGFR